MEDVIEERKKKFFNFLKNSLKSKEESNHDNEDNRDVIEERKDKIVKKFNLKKNWYWFVFAAIAWFGYWIRTRNLSLLIDSTTGKYIPLALDPHAFLRYVKYIVENGSLMTVDYMRYYPWGYANMVEFKLLSYFIVYLYKFLHFFSSAMTIEKAHNLYPPIAFVIGLIFFFLLVKKLFDYRVALLSSLLLTIIPMYLYRTLAGFSDKEAFAMIFFFAALYFFVVGWEHKEWKQTIIYGAIAGIITGLMGLVWGGMQFVVVIISLFTFISLFMIRYRFYHFLSFVVWILTYSIMLHLLRDIHLAGIISGFYNTIAFLILLSGFVFYGLSKNLFGLKEKFEKKLPLEFLSIIISLIIGSLLFVLLFGFDFFIGKFNEFYVTFTNPFGQSRWALTVAEAHQPFFTDWIVQMSWKYILVFLIGSIWLFKDAVNPMLSGMKNKSIAIGLFAFAIFGTLFNRYSQTATYLNGDSTISKWFYFGSLILFVVVSLFYYIFIFKKNEELFRNKSRIKESYILVLLWFYVMIIGARSASRLLFVLAPITCILFSFFVLKIFDISLNKKDLYKIGLWVLLFLILINPLSIASGFVYGIFDKGILNDFYTRSINQARYTGPSYNLQWQKAGGWVRENLPEDAVFAHWWDYGYWVQTGFERATVTDGGNAKGSLNHMMGRHFLTGQNEIEALEFFKAHNVTNALIISDEIGKFPAFSSIGADENWDRYSWINVFNRDDSQMKETRDGTIYVYTGGTPLDWDFEYKGKLYPKGASGIVAILFPVSNQNDTFTFTAQPQAVLVYNGKQDTLPLECVFIDGREIRFEEDGLGGCFVIIPRINDNTINPLGTGLYISEKNKNTLFYKMYLTNQKMEYFELVYNDEGEMPLSVYNGRVIGPLKIWNVTYPEDLEVPEIYYKDVLPNPAVENIKGRY